MTFFVLKSTENTPMIVGLGKAAELVSENLEKYASIMRETRDYLEQRLVVKNAINLVKYLKILNTILCICDKD